MKKPGGARWQLAQLAPAAVVASLVVAYVVIFGTLSLRRHQNLGTNALDLGYTDQAVWNTLHGRPFRFSTYLDAAFRLDIPIQEFRRPDILLGYHVEPILAAIAPLYLIHDGPETLLWLQTIGIALGAIPLYLIIFHRIRSRVEPTTGRLHNGASRSMLRFSLWLPVPFVLIYLLSPQLEAANLSDFHAVALSPALLLAAFYFLETDRPWGFVLFAFLAPMSKEEVGLLVAMMGLWAAFVRHRWWLGLGTVAAAAGWFLFSVQGIVPYFSGLKGSAFLVRYRHLGDSLVGMARNLVRQPELYVDWLRRPDVLKYLQDLWLAGGGLSILHPVSLLMAAPVIAINTFSSYYWMRSGGGHYSAAIVPFLVVSAAYGTDWLAWQLARGRLGELVGRRWLVYGAASLALATIGLTVSLVNHYGNGISPLSRRFALEPVSDHARRAEPFIEQVNSLPPEVPISVGSNLFPHVGHRQWVYLFPTISDAQYILLDVVGPSSPAGMGEQAQIVRELLDYAQFGVAESDHGFLLLQRDLDQYRLSPEFYETFQAGGITPQVPVGADFGGLFRLEGFDWDVRPVVRAGPVIDITTYWRARSAPDGEYSLVFFFWDEEDRLLRIQNEERAVHWYPTWLWEPGEVTKITLPPLPVGDVPHVGVSVLRPGTAAFEVAGRVVPITSGSGEPLSLWESGTILELVRP